MTTKALTAAALVIVLALSPSVGECLKAHQEDHPNKPLLWGWVGLVVVLALAFGEEFMGGS